MLRKNRMLPIYIGVFLISSSTLMLEISFIRLFSIAKWYHFAFMVVSIALFGFGASGSFLSVFRSLLKKDTLKLLSLFSALFSLSIIASLVITNYVPFDPFRIVWDRFQILYLMIYFTVLAVPFFFSGLCIALAISKMAKMVSKLYFSNLSGSGLGSLLVIPIFSLMPVSSVIIFTSTIAAVSCLLFSFALSRKNWALVSVWLVITVVLLGNAQTLVPINISPYKALNAALRYPDAQILFTEWNAFSRVDVIKSGFVRYAPGLSYEYRNPLPPQLGITIDGNSLTAITNYNGNPATLEFTEFLPMSLPYKLHENPKVLIIYPGGGLSVLTALHNNAHSVTAVEVNPIIVSLLKNNYREFSGGIYENEKVEVIVSEGRSFIRGSDDRFDIVELSLTGGVASSATGVYALSENYLYTTEAFEDYYVHLSEGGILSITRWLLPPPREGVRLVSLAVSALDNQGVTDPENHLVVVRSWNTITLLLKKGGFNSADVDSIREFCAEKKIDIVHIPGVTDSDVNLYNRFPEPYYYRMVQALLSEEGREIVYSEYLFDVTAVTDERPFFFHFFKWDKIIQTYESMGKKWQPFIEGGYLVPIILAQASVLSLIFIFLPVSKFRKMNDTSGKWWMLSYFSCLGFGYMFIEIVLIQRFILFLGHPVYATAVILFVLLTFSGVGSFLSGKFNVRNGGVLIPIICILSGIGMVYFIILSQIFHLLLGWEFMARLLVSSILIAPIGLVMGMPFPIGIRLTVKLNSDLIPWAWSVNGCSSVLGSILPIVIALSSGFSFVLALGSLIYLIGLGLILSLRRKGIV